MKITKRYPVKDVDTEVEYGESTLPKRLANMLTPGIEAVGSNQEDVCDAVGVNIDKRVLTIDFQVEEQTIYVQVERPNKSKYQSRRV